VPQDGDWWRALAINLRVCSIKGGVFRDQLRDSTSPGASVRRPASLSYFTSGSVNTEPEMRAAISVSHRQMTDALRRLFISYGMYRLLLLIYFVLYNDTVLPAAGRDL
jgi:hypothetical protein